MLLQVDVRTLTPADLPEVASLCQIARDESALGTQLCVGEQDRLERHIGTYAQMPDSSVFVARSDDQVVGFALVRTVPAGIFVDVPTTYVEAIFVSAQARRRGVGHNLLGAVAQQALDAGSLEVYALPLPGSRGVQRFLARLGFAPAAAHRVVSVPVLARNVANELGRSSRRSSGRVLDELIARRRKARIETNSGPLDLRAFQAAYEAGQNTAPTQPPLDSLRRDYHAG